MRFPANFRSVRKEKCLCHLALIDSTSTYQIRTTDAGYETVRKCLKTRKCFACRGNRFRHVLHGLRRQRGEDGEGEENQKEEDREGGEEVEGEEET